jgi:predicted acetyltransferase
MIGREDVRLIKPMLEMRDQYEGFLREFIDAGEDVFACDRQKQLQNVAAAIADLQDESKGLYVRDGWVPISSYWLLTKDNLLVGEIFIRHKLTPTMEDMGGNISYAVRPRWRGQGYATTMLMLALEEARSLGLKSVLMTCNPKNIASCRVLQKNGGMLISQSLTSNQTPGYNGRLTARYRIVL